MKQFLSLILPLIMVSGCAGTAPLQIRDPQLPGHQSDSNSEPDYDLGRPVADGRAYASYLKSQFALMRGDLENAVRYLKATTRRDPWASAPKMRLAGVLLMLNRPEQAGGVLAELSLDPEKLPPELLGVYVGSIINTDDVEAAQKAVKEAYRRQLLTPLQLLRWISNQENRVAAEKLLKFVSEMRAIRDGEAVLDCVDGHLEMRRGEYDTAASFLDRCLEEFPNWVPGMLERALVADLSSDEEQAKYYYEQVLAAQPGQALATWRLRSLSKPKGERKEARKELQRLLTEVRYETALQLASQALGEEDIARAEMTLSALSKDLQRRPRTLILFGAIDETRGKTDQALKKYLEAADNENIDLQRIAYLQWIRALRSVAGVDWERQARELYDDGPQPMLALAITLGLVEEDVQKAVVFIEQAIHKYPDIAELQYRLGVLFEQQGHRAKALDQMEKAIKVEPRHADALNFLGYSLAEDGQQLERAEALIRKAIGLKPNAGYIMDSLGWVLFRSGKADEAIGWLKKALNSEGSDPTILEHLGDAYAVTGQDEEARASYREALRIVEDVEEAKRLREKILRTRDP